MLSRYVVLAVVTASAFIFQLVLGTEVLNSQPLSQKYGDDTVRKFIPTTDGIQRIIERFKSFNYVGDGNKAVLVSQMLHSIYSSELLMCGFDFCSHQSSECYQVPNSDSVSEVVPLTNEPVTISRGKNYRCGINKTHSAAPNSGITAEVIIPNNSPVYQYVLKNCAIKSPSEVNSEHSANESTIRHLELGWPEISGGVSNSRPIRFVTRSSTDRTFMDLSCSGSSKYLCGILPYVMKDTFYKLYNDSHMNTRNNKPDIHIYGPFLIPNDIAQGNNGRLTDIENRIAFNVRYMLSESPDNPFVNWINQITHSQPSDDRHGHHTNNAQEKEDQNKLFRRVADFASSENQNYIDIARNGVIPNSYDVGSFVATCNSENDICNRIVDEFAHLVSEFVFYDPTSNYDYSRIMLGDALDNHRFVKEDYGHGNIVYHDNHDIVVSGVGNHLMSSEVSISTPVRNDPVVPTSGCGDSGQQISEYGMLTNSYVSTPVNNDTFILIPNCNELVRSDTVKCPSNWSQSMLCCSTSGTTPVTGLTFPNLSHHKGVTHSPSTVTIVETSTVVLTQTATVTSIKTATVTSTVTATVTSTVTSTIVSTKVATVTPTVAVRDTSFVVTCSTSVSGNPVTTTENTNKPKPTTKSIDATIHRPVVVSSTCFKTCSTVHKLLCGSSGSTPVSSGTVYGTSSYQNNQSSQCSGVTGGYDGSFGQVFDCFGRKCVLKTGNMSDDTQVITSRKHI